MLNFSLFHTSCTPLLWVMNFPQRHFSERIFMQNSWCTCFFFKNHMFSTFCFCEMEYGLSLFQSKRELAGRAYIKVQKVLYTMKVLFPLLLPLMTEERENNKLLFATTAFDFFNIWMNLQGSLLWKHHPLYLFWFWLIYCRSHIKKRSSFPYYATICIHNKVLMSELMDHIKDQLLG